MCPRFSLMILCILPISAGFAQDVDDDELSPGLRAEYLSGERTHSRIDGDIAFDWTSGSPALPLPERPFRVRWTGQLLLRSEGVYRFHAYLQGKLTVRVNDAVVLAGESETARWISGEDVEFSFGEFPLAVEYASSGTGRVMLCWSSTDFPLEPVPHHALFHPLAELPRGPFPQGAVALLQHRCDRCHGDLAGLTSSPGPSLAHIGVETSQEWLIDRIQHGGGDHGHMPKFGFTREESVAILTALQHEVKPVEWPAALVPKEIPPKDVDAGRELLVSLGCLACHEWNKQGRGGEFGGPSLDEAAKHRTARWLELWLSDSAKLNAQHLMPVITLSNNERRQIVSALVAQHPAFAVSRLENVSPELLQRGNKLLTEARCVRCHELPGPKRVAAVSPQWSEMKLEGDGCWSGEFKTTVRRPVFARVEADLLRSFVSSTKSLKLEISADLRGAQLMLQKGCLNCHDRDGRKGISAMAKDLVAAHPSLDGRAPWLIPPPLTAIGDRLPDDRLAKAIRGELPLRRLDWLLVRMPKYQYTDGEQAALLAHLIGHDRIPEKPPAMPEYPRSDKQESTSAGRELLGGKGFSCVACHPVKDFTPKQVALGTRGSNLFQIGDRLRPEYFYRWTRSPLRVMPGVEMPSYQRPHAVIYPGDLNRQLASIWTALNDPNLPTPVNPGAVEQYWTVGPLDSPRILRDVVTLPGKKEITIPRAFAVGFPNGHNILFDLDTASVRAWTVGDFAQQRTQGKSWFWDLVGTPVMVNETGESDFVILSEDGKTKLFPSESSSIRFVKAVIDRENVLRLSYAIQMKNEGHDIELNVLESWFDGKKVLNRLFYFDAEESRRLQVFMLKPSTIHVREPGEIEVDAKSPAKLPQFERPAYRLDSKSVQNLIVIYSNRSQIQLGEPPTHLTTLSLTDDITVVPGFSGRRLPYPTSIMPTAMTFNRHGRLLFTSLRGHVYSASDQEATRFAEGLAAPFGILDSHDMVLVAHKPEIVGLVDRDDDGRADTATVIATGWGLTDDYHDWTCGLVRDAEGNLFTTLGSDYAQKNRPKEKSRWRGHALKIDPAGKIESVARGLRFPTGVAMTSEQHVFITDQQGVQNTFNELNGLKAGARFGVPSLHEPEKDAPATPPAVQIPHPWTRSVNGIVAIPKSLADRTHPKLFDQLLGCEYDNRLLVRFSHQFVDGVMQGAVYPFSKPGSTSSRASEEFLGPLSIAVGPEGDVYVGSMHDSGWQGGLNTGDIVKLSPQRDWPNGLCEIRATPAGFDLEFFSPVDKSLAEDKSRYQISGYTRVWEGSYATPDTGRHVVEIDAAKLSGDGTTVSLTLSVLKPGYVYDVSISEIGTGQNRTLWPNIGHYTLHRLPTGK